MKELLKRLVCADTTAEKGELAAAEIICDELGRSGIDARIDSWDGNRANLVAHVKGAGHRGSLLFVCHLDVVGPGEESWTHAPFAATESDGRIYGRGTADMKGGIAATVTALHQVVESGVELQGDVIFLAVAGEETDSSGAKRFVHDGNELPELVGVIIPEPTDFEIVTAHRGILWLKVTTKGKAAHSSMPELGVNAITAMNTLLNELKSYKIAQEPHELLGKCSMSINTICGGKEINVVPDSCSISVDIRTLPSQDNQQLLADFEKIIAKLKLKNPKLDAEVSILRGVRALETDSNSDFVRDFCSCLETGKTKAVGFTTDGPHFASLGAPVVVFGPGKPEVCHKADEYIDIGDVEKAVEHYRNIMLRFLT